MLHIAKEDQTKGLADFALAVRVDPNNPDVYHHRGFVSDFVLYFNLLFF